MGSPTTGIVTLPSTVISSGVFSAFHHASPAPTSRPAPIGVDDWLGVVQVGNALLAPVLDGFILQNNDPELNKRLSPECVEAPRYFMADDGFMRDLISAWIQYRKVRSEEELDGEVE